MKKTNEQNPLDETKLKHKYGNVFKIEVPTDDENDVAVAYLKKPTRQTLSMIISKIDSDPISALEILLNSCWIDGSDERIRTDDDLFFGAVSSLKDMISFRQGVLKKI